MTATEMVNLFTNNVFSVVMCVLLFWYLTKQQEAHKAEIDALKKVQQEQTEKLTASVNALELAITKLTDRLEGAGK